MNEPGTFIMIHPVRRCFWFPHPLACVGNQGGFPLLWRRRTVAHRYYVRGVECDLRGEPIDAATEPSGTEIAQREADEAAGDNDPRDRVWGAK